MTLEPESEKPLLSNQSDPPASEIPSVKAELEEPKPRVQRDSIEVAAYAWSGPIPDPQTMALYNKIDPALVQFVMERAKNEQEHRHTQDAKIVTASIEAGTRGQYLGFGTTMSVVGAAVLIAVWGNPAIGGGLGALAIIHQGGMALYRQYKRDKRDKKPPKSLESKAESSDPE